MYILASDLKKNIINTYLKLDNRVVCRKFKPLNTFLSFLNKSVDYLLLYIRNLENSSFKPGFWYKISICLCLDRWKILNRYCVVEKYMLDLLI